MEPNSESENEPGNNWVQKVEKMVDINVPRLAHYIDVTKRVTVLDLYIMWVLTHTTLSTMLNLRGPEPSVRCSYFHRSFLMRYQSNGFDQYMEFWKLSIPNLVSRCGLVNLVNCHG